MSSKHEVMQLVASFTTSNPKGGRRISHRIVLATGTGPQLCKGAAHWKSLGLEWAHATADPSMNPSPIHFKLVRAW